MESKSPGRKALSVLASLRLAVVTMVALGGVCAFATFYEMRHGTPAVQRDVYQTPWFAFLLGLLGTNVLAVMVSRFPWTRHQIGFLAAHVGILAILAGSVHSLYGGLDSNMALFEGETSDRVMLLEKALRVSLPARGVDAMLPVVLEKRRPRAGRELRLPVPNSDVVLVADEFQPHVRVVESFAPAPSGRAAIQLTVQAPMATQQVWLAADDASRSHLDLGMVSLGLHTGESEEQARALLGHAEGSNHLSFVVGPGTTLRYAASDAQGALSTGVVRPGEPVATGWAGLGVSVDRFFPSAALLRSVEPEEPPAKEEKRRAAVRLHLEHAGARSEPEWVLWGEERSVRLGDAQALVGYRSPETSLPFRVTLLRFNNESYPGSRMASTYESTVRVDDPEKGSFETLISMNHPLHHRGYIFFQSSFVEGRPMMSIFSVARAPGLPLVYAGTTLVGLGIVWMFYVKPYLARRQAARALAERRNRENAHEVEPSRPDPAGSAAGEPAPGGA